MKLWICDSRVGERWEKWLQPPPVPENWSVVQISNLTQIPVNDEPSLLLIHSNDQWTKGIPSAHPSALVVRYTTAEQDLGIQSTTGHLFCSLNTLQEQLPQILQTWHTAMHTRDWLWDMLGGNVVLEVTLELLHQLLPPALNQTSPQGQHLEVWNELTEYVHKLKQEPNFKDIETAYNKAHSLYKTCMTVDEKYVENLRHLRDSLLGTNASTGLVDVVTRARRGNGV
jgi:RNAse (barnase) inhibitor barstar